MKMEGELVGASTGGELLLKKRLASSSTDSISRMVSMSMGDSERGDVCEVWGCVAKGDCGGEEGGVLERDFELGKTDFAIKRGIIKQKGKELIGSTYCAGMIEESNVSMSFNDFGG